MVQALTPENVPIEDAHMEVALITKQGCQHSRSPERWIHRRLSSRTWATNDHGQRKPVTKHHTNSNDSIKSSLLLKRNPRCRVLTNKRCVDVMADGIPLETSKTSLQVDSGCPWKGWSSRRHQPLLRCDTSLLVPVRVEPIHRCPSIDVHPSEEGGKRKCAA